jgi:antitoxin VapB
VDSSRHVRLFRNGRNQAVRIPRDLELPGEEALMFKEGNRLIIEALARPSLMRLLDGWGALDVDWLELADRPPGPVDLGP